MADAALVRRVRWRLLAWSGGTTLVALVALGSLLYVAVAWSLASAGEQQLRTRAQEIAAGLATSTIQGGELNFGPTSGPADVTPGASPFTVSVDRASVPGLVLGGPTSGTLAFVVDASEGSLSWAEPDALAALQESSALAFENARKGIETVVLADLRGTPVRLLSMPLTRGQDQLVIQVLGDRTAELKALTVLLAVLAAGGALVLAASLAVGWVYAERALVPIRDALRHQREFAADASHEFRTPLAVVRGSVEDLRRNAHQPVVEVGHALDDIELEVDRLTAMVDDLLLLARTDSGLIEIATEPTDLAEIALDAAEGLVTLASKRQVQIRVDAEPVPMTADPARLRQLVTILIDNAVRQAPAVSTVDVAVAAVDGRGRLRVEDRGAGFRDEDLARVFDRFWRASDAPPDGTGLGLSIAAWIAERHSGSIAATNRPGGGARLEVVLPLP